MAVTVFDNGIGMNTETLTRLQRQLAEGESATGKSIGLKNVHARMRQACGEPYGITIESEPDIGIFDSNAVSAAKGGAAI